MAKQEWFQDTASSTTKVHICTPHIITPDTKFTLLKLNPGSPSEINISQEALNDLRFFGWIKPVTSNIVTEGSPLIRDYSFQPQTTLENFYVYEGLGADSPQIRVTFTDQNENHYIILSVHNDNVYRYLEAKYSTTLWWTQHIRTNGAEGLEGKLHLLWEFSTCQDIEV